MRDGLGIVSELDRLFPTEKLRDPKARAVRQEGPPKKKEEKGSKDPSPGEAESKKETPADPSKDQDSGKILDILI
jgi:hypothetical protein